MNRRSIVSAVLVVVLVGGVVGLALAEDPGPFDDFCTMEGLLVEAPEGWDFHRDSANDCEWTLINEDGRRAPASLYDGLPIEAPTALPPNPVRLALWLQSCLVWSG